LSGGKGRPRNLSIAHFPVFEDYDKFHYDLQQTYKKMKEVEQRSESYFVDDAELVVVSYGIASRNAYGAVKQLREEGHKVGLLRPITLFPFPEDALRDINNKGKKVMVVEMSAGQMALDVRLICNGSEIALMPGQATAEVPGINSIKEWCLQYMNGKLEKEHVLV